MPIVYVGTIGQSVWRSRDGGETFQHFARGMWFENNVRSLVARPDDPNVVYAGADDGLYRLDGETWVSVPSPMDGKQIWSLAFAGPNRLFAGTCPAGLYRSDDGGTTWEAGTGDPIAQSCLGGGMKTRVTRILPHPHRPDVIYAGIEVDGPRRSDDGGRTWHRFGGELLAPTDVHDLLILGDGTLICGTNHELFRSRDDGATWTPLRIKEHFPTTYCRGLAQSPNDSNAFFVGIGNAPPGNVGGLYRSEDGGDRWEAVHLHGVPNSTVWQFAACGAWVFATTVLGQLYRSVDGGDHWGKVSWEFGEIRALLAVKA
jgi:photosystem II stability/assembly factor-like uncharacterized protein